MSSLTHKILGLVFPVVIQVMGYSLVAPISNLIPVILQHFYYKNPVGICLNHVHGTQMLAQFLPFLLRKCVKEKAVASL